MSHPVLCVATATFDYDPPEGATDKLTLRKGDVISVYTKYDSGWWVGSINPKPFKGLFPGSYAAELPELPALAGSGTGSGAQGTTLSDTRSKELTSSRKVLFRARVIFPFAAAGRGEVSLNKGDIVEVIKLVEEDGWWRGIVDGEVGHFPGEYVQRIDEEVGDTSAETKLKSKKGENKLDNVERKSKGKKKKARDKDRSKRQEVRSRSNSEADADHSDLVDQGGSKPKEKRKRSGKRKHSSKSKSKSDRLSSKGVFDEPDEQAASEISIAKDSASSKEEAVARGVCLARAKFDYEKREKGELSFSAGDEMTILLKKEDGKGWWLALLNGEKGHVPSAWVEEIDPSKPNRETVPPVEVVCRAKVLFDYSPEEEGQLALTQGSVFDVYDKDIGRGWGSGALNGEVGPFPQSFVEWIEPSQPETGAEAESPAAHGAVEDELKRGAALRASMLSLEPPESEDHGPEGTPAKPNSPTIVPRVDGPDSEPEVPATLPRDESEVPVALSRENSEDEPEVPIALPREESEDEPEVPVALPRDRTTDEPEPAALPRDEPEIVLLDEPDIEGLVLSVATSLRVESSDDGVPSAPADSAVYVNQLVEDKLGEHSSHLTSLVKALGDAIRQELAKEAGALRDEVDTLRATVDEQRATIMDMKEANTLLQKEMRQNRKLASRAPEVSSTDFESAKQDQERLRTSVDEASKHRRDMDALLQKSQLDVDLLRNEVMKASRTVERQSGMINLIWDRWNGAKKSAGEDEPVAKSAEKLGASVTSRGKGGVVRDLSM